MDEKVAFLQKKACEMRRLIIEMISSAQSGHPGGSLSSVEILACLYFNILRHDPNNPHWEERDRFHLSKGHACPAYYSALTLSGYFDRSHIYSLRKFGGILQGHADSRVPGIDIGSGSLGQGLSVALGMALAGRLDKKSYRVYCLMGDGEIQEGNIWEAAMAAAHYKVDTLCGIIDCNHFQIDGRTDDIMNLEPLGKKWESFGWNVICCNGHDIEALLAAFAQVSKHKGNPSMIIADTVKGKGVSFMENVVDFHGRAPSEEEKKRALDELSDIK